MGELQNNRDAVVEEIFKDYDIEMKGELTAEQIQIIHQDIRVGSISIPQVKESIKYVCIDDTCEQSELFDLLQEMDRRYYLIQDFRWEFSMLDRNKTDTITEDQAKWFVGQVHGEFFSRRKWEAFLRHRGVPGSGVSFAEIEVLLCNIPSKLDMLEEEEEARKERAEKAKREKERRELLEREKEKRKRQRESDKQLLDEEEKKRRKEMERKIQEDQEERRLREREMDEANRRKKDLEDEEERGNRENEERDRLNREEAEERRRKEEAKRLQDEEEERRRRELEEAENYEKLLKEAHEKEQEYSREADHHNKRFKGATDDKLKREAEEAEKRARLKQREWKNKRIRLALKVAIKKKDRERLPPAVADFKNAKLPDDDMDLPKAEKILREFSAKDGLMEAMINPHREGLDRHIDNLEKAITYVKRNGYEYLLTNEIKEAEKLLLQLKKRYKIYAEIMALDQPTVAEIKSYSKPPVLVHQVMTGVFVMLGHKEKEMKDWQNVRIWVGKTGKDGLKRRCLQYLKEPEKVVVKDAERTRDLLHNIDLDDVRDTSAGAATFYVWAWTMVEETDIRIQQAKEDAEILRKQVEEKKKKKAEAAAKAAESAGQNDEENTPETETSQAPEGSDVKQSAEGDNNKQENTEESEEQAQEMSRRIGKETGDKFTLSKTGKVKKTKDKNANQK